MEEDVRGVHLLVATCKRPRFVNVITMIRPSGIGGGLTLLSRADTRILHCIGKGMTDAKEIQKEIGLSTERIYARAMTLKEHGILEDRKGIHLSNGKLPKKLASFLSVSLERSDVLANMGIRFLISMREPAPGRIIANRAGAKEATYFSWYRKIAHTGIVVSNNGVHRIRYDLWPGLSELMDLFEEESRARDNRIPESSKVIWMDGSKILFSDEPGKPFQRTAFSAFNNMEEENVTFYTTYEGPLNEQDIFDDAVHICDSTDDPMLRLKTIDYLLDRLGIVVPDNDFVRSFYRSVRGLESKGWPDKDLIMSTFGDITELVRAMMPYEGPKFQLDYRTETFKMYPNRTQRCKLKYTQETCMILYNELLNHYLLLVMKGRMPKETEIRDHMVHEIKRNSPNAQRYQDAPSTVLINVCTRVFNSLSKVYKDIVSGREPRIPKPKKRVRSFTYTQVKGGVSFPIQADGTKRVRLSKIDMIRYDGHRVSSPDEHNNTLGRRIPFDYPVPGDMRLCRVIEKDDRQWYFQIVYRSSKSEPRSSIPEHERTAIGIDLGVTDLVTTSEGDHYPNPREHSKIQKKIAREQSRMNRSENGSAKQEKHRMRLAHLYDHYNNRQKDNLHKLSLELVRKHDMIAFEDINIKRLIIVERNKQLRFGQSEANWRRLTDMVDYKSVPMGTTVVYVDPRNTSQLCSGCRKIVKKDLKTRIHDCPYCGLTMDRDENAALNILRRGKEKVNGANAGNRTRIPTLARSSASRYTTFAAPPYHSTYI